jgi:uncharacterized Fe-S cluster-containing radical SAM superfamily protein
VTAQPKTIATARVSQRLRERAVNVDARKLLVSRLDGSDQEDDLAVPPNCKGYGRIRHFRMQTSPGWPSNPLPIIPACKALGMAPPPMMEAQVFQNAACAWRCWYCFVPFNLLSANPKRSAWLSAEELVALYRADEHRPLIIDLSGGSPDLVPEWVPWMMQALRAAGLDRATYLWSDDNLSTRYLFERLSKKEIAEIREHRNYGRVCCFKGFDSRSFSFNTQAAPHDFDLQFDIMRQLLALGLDTYGYVTLTAEVTDGLDQGMARFFDRLQQMDHNLPLRIVPLEIREFGSVTARLDDVRRRALEVQQQVIAAWNNQIQRRFDSDLRNLDIASVPLATRP